MAQIGRGGNGPQTGSRQVAGFVSASVGSCDASRGDEAAAGVATAAPAGPAYAVGDRQPTRLLHLWLSRRQPPPPPPMQQHISPAVADARQRRQPPPRGEPVSLHTMTPSVRYEDTEGHEDAEPSRLQSVRSGSGLLRLVAMLVVVLGLGAGATGTGRTASSPASSRSIRIASGAEVFVDGQSRGMTPITLSLSPGPHSLEAPPPRSEPRDLARRESRRAGEPADRSVEHPCRRHAGRQFAAEGREGAGRRQGRRRHTADPL